MTRAKLSLRGVAKSFEGKEVLRAVLAFRRLNLSTPPFPMQGPFDAVFCRNVMIYFNKTTQAEVVARLDEHAAGDCLVFESLRVGCSAHIAHRE